MEFKKIFERHFFSNHHVEAQLLEAELSNLFRGSECVTFSSFHSLLVSIIDEIHCEKDNLSIDCNEAMLKDINLFLTATNRTNTTLWEFREEDIAQSDVANTEKKILGLIIGLIKSNGEPKGFILDLSCTSPLANSCAAFITKDPALAEKIRWSRSSYGRLSSSRVNIAANGRVSEFQAMLVNDAIINRCWA